MIRIISFMLLLCLFESNLNGLYSLLTEANRERMEIYYHDGKRETIKGRKESKERIRMIAESLEQDGFSFNHKNDTVVICFNGTDYLVKRYHSLFMRVFRGFYLVPSEIQAYSSLGISSLILDEANKVTSYIHVPLEQSIASSIREQEIIELIINEENDKLAEICDLWSVSATDVMLSSYLRIEIKDGKVISSINWHFYLDPNYYSDCSIQPNVLSTGIAEEE